MIKKLHEWREQKLFQLNHLSGKKFWKPLSNLTWGLVIIWLISIVPIFAECFGIERLGNLIVGDNHTYFTAYNSLLVFVDGDIILYFASLLLFGLLIAWPSAKISLISQKYSRNLIFQGKKDGKDVWATAA